MSIKIDNKLDKALKAFFLPEGDNTRRGAGRQRGIGNGRHNRVPPESDSFIIDDSQLGKTYEFHIEIEELPVLNGKRALAIGPGFALGTVHHSEFHEKGDGYMFVFHMERETSSIQKQHKDPRVFHPDEPGGSEEN